MWLIHANSSIFYVLSWVNTWNEGLNYVVLFLRTLSIHNLDTHCRNIIKTICLKKVFSVEQPILKQILSFLILTSANVFCNDVIVYLFLSEQEDHPRWVQHFRLACHPATTVGIHRHLACDKGFFNLVNICFF